MHALLDESFDDLGSWAQGDIDLVRRDLADRDVQLDAIEEAFLVRKNIINLKKIAAHTLESLRDVGADLARGTFWHYNDITVVEQGFVLGPRYEAFSRAYATVQGAIVAALDVRTMLKAIARIPRNPYSDIPRDLKTGLDSRRRFQVSGEEEEEDLDDDWLVPIRDVMTASDDPALLWRVLVRRGATKAVRMRYELGRLLPAMERLVVDLKSLPRDSQALDHRAAAKEQKAKAMIRGALGVFEDAVTCLTLVHDCGGTEELFKASDDRRVAAFYSARGDLFSETTKILARDLDLAKQFRDVELVDAIDTGSFRSRVVGKDENSAKKRQCTRCGSGFGRLWLTRQTKFRVCVQCDRAERILQGRCPIKSKHCIPPRSWCPHQARCFACEAASCDLCRLVTLDGPGLGSFIDDLGRVDKVFLDFDRTLASTRSGASPLRSSNVTCDPHLAALARMYPVTVVTRNRHRDDILTFLRHHDVPVLDVVHVSKGRSKADVVLWDPLPVIVFADDDVRELLDPSLDDVVRGPPSSSVVHRVLFSRAIDNN